MSFLEEFERLRLKKPHIGLQCVQNENSPFCQYTEKSKNCYMTFASYTAEDCLYNHRVFYCRDCVDCAQMQKSELCYECVDCINAYNCNYSVLCRQSTDCDFCYDCVNIQNCFGCVGLRQKSYCIFNQQYKKEDYQREVEVLKKLPPDEIYPRLEPLLTTVPRNAMYGENNEGSYGDNIRNCKDCFWVFDSFGLHDCYYTYNGDDAKNLYDVTHLGWAEECFEIMSGGNLNNCMFCSGCWFSNGLTYCELVYNSHDCFGCVGLNHVEYAILNVPYSKEEYFKRVAEIKEGMKQDGTWGKWFASTYPEVITYGY